MEFSISTEVEAPIERVWPIMEDVERWPEWTASIRRVQRLDGGPFHVGSRAKVEQPKLPPATWQVTRIDGEGSERRYFEWQAGAPGFRSVGWHEVVRRPDGGSLVTLSIRTTGIIGRLFSPLMSGITRRYVSMEAAGLKARAEQEAGARSA